MQSIVFVFIGGGLGSIVRYLVSKNWNSDFSYATLLVNIIGCILIGIFTACYQKEYLSQQALFFLAVGFCGGLTTFSTFALEMVEYMNANDYKSLFIYLILSVVIGILAVFLGFKLVR